MCLLLLQVNVNRVSLDFYSSQVKWRAVEAVRVSNLVVKQQNQKMTSQRDLKNLTQGVSVERNQKKLEVRDQQAQKTKTVDQEAPVTAGNFDQEAEVLTGKQRRGNILTRKQFRGPTREIKGAPAETGAPTTVQNQKTRLEREVE